MRHFFKNTKEMALSTRHDPVTKRSTDSVNDDLLPEQQRPCAERFAACTASLSATTRSRRVACLCCSTACPAQCIFIEAGEYPEGDKRRGCGRFPVKFVIDELRCVFCGFCVEACPCDAIRMVTGVHAVPYGSRDQFIYSKDLLVGADVRAEASYDETAKLRHEPRGCDPPQHLTGGKRH